MEVTRVEILEAILSDLKKPIRKIAQELGVGEGKIANFMSQNGIRKGDLMAGKVPLWYKKEKEQQILEGKDIVEIIDYMIDSDKTLKEMAWELGTTPTKFKAFRTKNGIKITEIRDGVYPSWYLREKGLGKRSKKEIEEDAKGGSPVDLHWLALYACICNHELTVSKAVELMGVGERPDRKDWGSLEYE